MNLTKKQVEKILLFVGATLLIAFGLFWNLYSDLAANATASTLFIGLLTSIVGGVFVYLGTSFNNFDVTIKGLIFNVLGGLLGIGNVIYLLVSANGQIPVYSLVTIIGVGIGACAIIAGIVLELLRIKDNEETIVVIKEKEDAKKIDFEKAENEKDIPQEASISEENAAEEKKLEQEKVSEEEVDTNVEQEIK